MAKIRCKTSKKKKEKTLALVGNLSYLYMSGQETSPTDKTRRVNKTRHQKEPGKRRARHRKNVGRKPAGINKFLFQSIDKSGTPRSALVTHTRGNYWQIRRIPIRLAASRSEQDPDPNTHALLTMTDSETWLIQATFSLIYLSYIKALPYQQKPEQGSAEF